MITAGVAQPTPPRIFLAVAPLHRAIAPHPSYPTICSICV
jgi:hypothetical protein